MSKRKFQKIRGILFLLLALLSLGYYAVCVIYAWAGVSWLWLWLLLAGFCAARATMLFLEATSRINPPRIFRIIYGIFAAAAVAIFAIVEINIISAMNTQPKDGLDNIIILGCAVRGDDPTTPLILRINTAYDYLVRNPDTVAIASGGQGAGESISEAECIKSRLVDMGIDDERIITEDSSADTNENLANSFAIIGDGSETGIVTNGFHIYRSLLTARLLGHDNVSGIPAQTLMPLGIHYVVREFFGVIQLLLFH